MLPKALRFSASQQRSRRLGWAAIAFAGILGLASTGPLVGLAPEPDPVPRRWELQVDPGQLRLVTVDVPNVGARKYLYMTYKVVNNSGQDLLFAPSFELSDGDGNVTRSGRDVPQAVTQFLLNQTQDPFIQDQIGVIGEFMQGEENAKDGLVVWPLEGMSPSQITVYAAGFSGETKTVTSPDGKQKFILRKTLRLNFQAPGDLSGVRSTAFPLSNKTWIMR